MRDGALWDLVAVFAPLSLLAFGGGQSIVADIDHQVLAHHWMTQAQFVDLFAISRAAPGPGALLATLVGWKAQGWVGAAVASLALFVPSSLLAYAMSALWRRFDGHRVTLLLEVALAPIAAGLLIAGALAVIRASSGAPSVWAIALVALGVFLLRPKLNPLVVLAAAGIAGALLGAAPALAAPAEYAFRWDPALGGPGSGSAVAGALGLRVDKVKIYRIDYYDVAGDPASPTIARRRTSGDKTQLTLKLRQAEGRGAGPAPTCALGGSAQGKTEVDVTLLADGRSRRALSFSCTLEGARGLAFAPELHPVARGCVATMRRYRTDDMDIEEWSVHDGAQRLIEVSMKGEDDAATRRRFEEAVVAPLLAAKATPLAASKTEFASACKP